MKIVRNVIRPALSLLYLWSALASLKRKYDWVQKLRATGRISKSGEIRWLLCQRLQFIWRDTVESFARADVRLMRHMKLTYHGERFFYSPDFRWILLLPASATRQEQLGNLPIDCEYLLRHGLGGLREKIVRRQQDAELSADHRKNLKSFALVCDGLEVYWRRASALVKRYGRSHTLPPQVGEYFSAEPFVPATGLHSALQSILLVNAVFWTAGMRLVGLSRLDQILLPYFEMDLASGALDDSSARELIKEFLRSLDHEFYFKSSVLAGDTGQSITLSGVAADGSDTTNRLSYLFLESIAQLKRPDPKLIVRVHANTPEALWQTSIECMKAGTGSPLLSNDDKVIPAMVAHGYRHEDAFCYATSACWEPLVPGLSVDQNNIGVLNFLAPLDRLLTSSHNASDWRDFTHFFRSYLEEVSVEVQHLAKSGARLRRYSPLLSLFIDDCVERALDCSRGGARYSNMGWTSTALGNTVNALLNIDELVFRQRQRTLAELTSALRANFVGHAMLRGELIAQDRKYATDSLRALEITNEIIAFVDREVKPLVNVMGGHFRFGVSSPSHVSCGLTFPASLDGRLANQPFMVHIAPSHIGRPVTPVEAAHFAAGIDYTRAFNGGVFDMVIDHHLAYRKSDLLLSFFRTGFAEGIYQAQANLIDLRQLRDALQNPEKYPNLIVRVWGFSAYFRDLPAEYRKVLVDRAEAAYAAGF